MAVSITNSDAGITNGSVNGSENAGTFRAKTTAAYTITNMTPKKTASLSSRARFKNADENKKNISALKSIKYKKAFPKARLSI